MGMRCIYRTNHLHLATTGLPHSDSSPPIRQKRRKLRVRNNSKRKLTKPFWGRERAWRCKGPRGGERSRRRPPRPALGRRGLTQSTTPSLHTSLAGHKAWWPISSPIRTPRYDQITHCQPNQATFGFGPHSQSWDQIHLHYNCLRVYACHICSNKKESIRQTLIEESSD